MGHPCLVKKWTTWTFDQAKCLFNTVGHRGAFTCGLIIIRSFRRNDSVDALIFFFGPFKGLFGRAPSNSDSLRELIL